MADVTSGLLNINTAARFQLTAERFPVGESTTRDNSEDDYCTKAEVSSGSSDAEDRRSASSDLSVTTRSNCTNEQRPLVDVTCWSGDGPHSHSRNDVDGGLERLAADSAVGRLALMIQRFAAANNQRDLPVMPLSSQLCQVTPPRLLMTSPDDVTSSGDRARYHCHVCSYVGSSKADFNEHVNSHFEYRCSHCSYSARTKGRLRRHARDFHGTQLDDVSQTSTSVTYDHHHHHHHHHHHQQQQQQQRLMKCKQCPFSTRVREEFWVHSRVHIRHDRMLVCPKCPFVTEFKHHLEYHLRNHVGSKPFRCTRCNYACVNRSMLNSHAKSHTNVFQYRCADCAYATKYCHSLKLHLRKHEHRPAAVLNADGSLPTDGSGGFDCLTRRGPPQGPRTAPPPPLSRRKLSLDDVTGGIKRAWSAEAQVDVSQVTSETVSRRLPANNCRPLEQFPDAAEVTSLSSYDPYAFVVDDDTDCPNWRRVEVRQHLLPANSDDSVAAQHDDGVMSMVDDERHLPVRKRLRNAEFVARLTADIEAELDAENRPLDLTAKVTAAMPPSPTSKTTANADVAQKEDGDDVPSKISLDAQPVHDAGVTSSPASSNSSDTSRGARRRKGVAQRRVDVIVNRCDDIREAAVMLGSWTSDKDRAALRQTSPLPDRRGFVECRHCRIGFRDRVTYTLHMGYHGFDAPFSCNMCGHQAADRIEFFVHIATAAH